MSGELEGGLYLRCPESIPGPTGPQRCVVASDIEHECVVVTGGFTRAWCEAARPGHPEVCDLPFGHEGDDHISNTGARWPRREVKSEQIKNSDTAPARGVIRDGIATVVIAISGDYPDNGNGRTIAAALQEGLRALAELDANLAAAIVRYRRDGVGPRTLVITAAVNAPTVVPDAPKSLT